MSIEHRTERMKARQVRMKVKETFLPAEDATLTNEQIDAMVKQLVDAHRLQRLIEGEQLPSDVDTEAFSTLPADLLERMQDTADVCATLLAKPADEDDFPDHELRTQFSETNRKAYGSAFAKLYEDNRFKLGVLGSVASELAKFKYALEKESRRSEREDQHSLLICDDGSQMTRLGNIWVLVNDLQHFLGDISVISDKYKKMPIKEKLVLVVALSKAARKYLELVTPPGTIPPLTQRSPIWPDSAAYQSEDHAQAPRSTQTAAEG